MKRGRRSIRTGPYGERLGLGERLVAARRWRGLRQRDAAREIGVSRETVARIEVDHIPSDRTRAKVLRWLEAQEAAFAAAAKAERAARRARARKQRGLAQRVGGVRRGVRARLAVKRRAQRAFRVAAAEGKGSKSRRR